MQSQLEAALLGTISANVNASTLDDDEDEETPEDAEEFVEEEVEEYGRGTKHFPGGLSTPRCVTLQMLLAAEILQPGNGTMTIEYLGQKFVGDLLEDGKIRSQETDIVFASPSAWAIACKRFINPDKKSGCGWASIRYKGRKLDVYKNIWYRKRTEERNRGRENPFHTSHLFLKTMANAVRQYNRIVVKHNTIANRTVTHDANTLIECVPFSSLGKIQPFLVSISTNAALVMDFHCHLMKAEVSGYLAGHWDFNSHSLQITRAYPCRSTKSDRDNVPKIESEISKSIERGNLLLVGWYHSHPSAAAAPTLRDVDAQLDYQIRMKGTNENNYTPCIGFIISPYNQENTSLESSIISYWVTPPPESKPNEYGRPMLMSYSVIQDSTITATVKQEMSSCVEYYRSKSGFVNFKDTYVGNTLYIDKLKSTLVSKFPRDESESALWAFVREALGCTLEDKDNLLSIPSIGKGSSLLGSNLILPTDISSLLFNSGKFPSATSLLGLPDPMAHSTLAANNMFLSTNLFKMQELLKPLSSSSPLPGKSKEKQPHLKIPTDIKNKSDFAAELLNFKNKYDFMAPEYLPRTDYSSVLDLGGGKKKETSMEYSLNLSRSSTDVRRSEYRPMDFTVTSAASKSETESATDLSVSSGREERPLNLSAE